MEKLSSVYCDICRGKGLRKEISTICEECREFYCKDCSDSHLILKATRNHVLIDLLSTNCDICLGKGIESKARTICKECREFYCKDCSDSHTILKATRDHILLELDPPDGQNPPLEHSRISETELSSDFLQYLTEVITVNESAGSSRAQVAVEKSGCTQVEWTCEEGLEDTVGMENIEAKLRVCPGELSMRKPRDRSAVWIKELQQRQMYKRYHGRRSVSD